MSIKKYLTEHKRDIKVYASTGIIRTGIATVLNLFAVQFLVVRYGLNKWWHTLTILLVTNLILLTIGYTTLKAWKFNQTTCEKCKNNITAEVSTQ